MSAAQCVLNVLSAVALMPSLSSVAADVSYPTRPVRVIVPLAPGGGTDNLSRIMAPPGARGTMTRTGRVG